MSRILLAFLCLHSFVLAALAAAPMSGEIATAKQWMKTVLLGDRPGKPFSFVYDGKSSFRVSGTRAAAGAASKLVDRCKASRKNQRKASRALLGPCLSRVATYCLASMPVAGPIRKGRSWKGSDSMKAE